MNWRVEILEWPAARAAARGIRDAVFVREQRVPIELEWDEMDEVSLHALATSEAGGPLGTGRLLPDGRIGRMAVLLPWRGRGVGESILFALIERAAARGLRRVVLHAQTHASGFYARRGFCAEGGEFLEAGIAHITMTRALPAAPVADRSVDG